LPPLGLLAADGHASRQDVARGSLAGGTRTLEGVGVMSAKNSPLCRFCRQPLEHAFADLGGQPLANSNLTPAEVPNERRYPLIARVCSNCLLGQVDDAVPPSEIFTHYDYFSSMSTEWVAHAKRYSDAMRPRLSLGPQSLVVEVASN